MNLFEFKGPREYLTFCCFCTGMTIESISEEGTKLIAKGKVFAMDMIDHGSFSEELWIAELTQNADWLVYKPKREDDNPNFNLIDQVDKNIKRFILKQLKLFMAKDRQKDKQIEIDPDDDLPPENDGTCPWRVLAVQKIL